MQWLYTLLLSINLVYSQLDRRILFGLDVDNAAAFPYIVAIAHNGTFKCGGVIIEESYVLTAYHCVEELPFEDYYLEAGTFDISAMNGVSASPDRNLHDIESMWGLPSDDLALLKLESPLNFTDSVGKITLANSYDPVDNGQSYIVAGWGGGSNILRWEYTNQTCCSHNDYNEIHTQKNSSYAVVQPKDAGGPLVREIDGIEVLYGIIKNTSICQNSGNLNISVHVRVSEFRSWIEEMTELILENPPPELSGNPPKNICPGGGGSHTPCTDKSLCKHGAVAGTVESGCYCECWDGWGGFNCDQALDDNGGGYGDPHFRMWTSVDWFEYHGECDLVLLDDPRLNLTIHVRTKIQSWYSFIEKAAISINGQVMEIKRNQKFWVNGESLNEPPAYFAGYPMLSLKDRKWCHWKHCSGAVIQLLDLGSDGHIVFTIWKGYIYVHVSARDGFWESTGILGKRGVSGMFSRNNVELFDSKVYAEEWQVRDYEKKLFMQDRYPQHPQPCIPPPDRNSRRMPEYDASLRRRASDACSELSRGSRDSCIFDVWATEDFDLISPYLLLEQYTQF